MEPIDELLKYVADQQEKSGLDIFSLPSLPSGTATIGYVNVGGTVDVNPLPAGTETIGNVGVTGSLPAGSKTIGTVGLASTSIANWPSVQDVALTGGLNTGSNNFGSVSVGTAPSVTLTNNLSSINATITNSLSTAIVSLPALPAGNNTLGSVNVANFNSFITANTSIILTDTFSSLQTSVWDISVGAGDFVTIDGNTLGSHYLVISKDPAAAGTSTTVTSRVAFSPPFDISTAVTLNRRQIGCDMNVQYFSSEEPFVFTDIEVASLSQTTTTLTVSTSGAHGLFIGDRIGIRGFSDQRFNYPSLIVATTPNSRQFTCTNGGDGNTLVSLTASGTATAGTTFVYRRATISNAPNGVALSFENGTATNHNFYINDGNRPVPPSGAPATNHNIAAGTTATVFPVSTGGQYALQPSTEIRLQHLGDQIVWLDTAIDQNAYIGRNRRIQTVPDPSKQYKLRFAARSSQSFAGPFVPIFSVTRSGTSVVTVVTDVPHGLTAGDIFAAGTGSNVSILANFTGVSVATVVNSVTFTYLAASSTGVSYGGVLQRFQGNIYTHGFNVTNLTFYRFTNILTAQFNAGISGNYTVGEYVNVLGVRNSIGNKLSPNIEGLYRVREISGISILLDPMTSDLLGADFGSTVCGGAVIRRQDFRIHFARVLKADRQRTEPVTTGMPIGGAITEGNDCTAVNPVLAGGWNNNNLLRLATDTNGAIIVPPSGNSYDINNALLTTLNSTISPTVTTSFSNQVECSFMCYCTVSAGASYDLSIEESENGVNYYKVYDFPRFTSNVQTIIRSPRICFNGRSSNTSIRYVQLLTGTTGQSVLRTINRQWFPQQSSNSCIRRMIDRTINLYTPGSTTGILSTPNCNRFNVMCAVTGTASSAGTIQLQGSEDAQVWYPIGNLLTPVSTTPTFASFTDVSSTFVRVAVIAAPAAGLTLDQLHVKSF